MSEKYGCPKCKYSGTWMGLSVHHSKSHGEKLDKSEYVKDDVIRVKSKLGKVPTRREYREHGKFSPPSCADSFGSWNNTLRACGFQTNKELQYDKQELIDELLRLEERLGRTPKFEDMKDSSKYSVTPYKRVFGSWNGALEACGMEPNSETNISKDRAKSELTRLAENLGRTPTAFEMDDIGKYSHQLYVDKFGSWNEALEFADLDIITEWSVRDIDERKLYDWKLSVKQRDSFTCQDCGEYGSAAHHIKRKAKHPELMFDVSNGVTLCMECHARRHEGENVYEMMKTRAKDLSTKEPNTHS